VTICGSLGPICRSVITVGLVRVGVRIRVWVRVTVRLELRLGLGLGLGLQTVVYKLLEKATKCGSVT